MSEELKRQIFNVIAFYKNERQEKLELRFSDRYFLTEQIYELVNAREAALEAALRELLDAETAIAEDECEIPEETSAIWNRFYDANQKARALLEGRDDK